MSVSPFFEREGAFIEAAGRARAAEAALAESRKPAVVTFLSAAEAGALSLRRVLPARYAGLDAGVLRCQADELRARARLAKWDMLVPAAEETLAANDWSTSDARNRLATAGTVPAARDHAAEQVDAARSALAALGAEPVEVADDSEDPAAWVGVLERRALVLVQVADLVEQHRAHNLKFDTEEDR